MVDRARKERNLLHSSLLTILFVLAALLIRYGLLNRLGDRFIWSSFYPAVVVAALFGGWYQGLFATVLSGIIVIALFFGLPVPDTKQEILRVEWISFLVFLFNSLLVSWVAERFKKLSDKNRKTLTELQEKNARWQAVNENLPDSFIYLTSTDANGEPVIHYVSDGIRRFVKAEVEEVLLQPARLTEIIIDEDQPLFQENRRKAILHSCPLNMDVRYRSPEGEIRWAHIRSKPRSAPDGRLVWDGLFTDITERRKLEKELEDQLLFNQQLITEMVIRENEADKKKMAYELHEDINQILAGAKMYLDMAKSAKNQETGLLQESSGMIRLAMHKINSLFESLGDPGLEGLDFRESVEILIEELNKHDQLEINLEMSEESSAQLTPHAKIILLQIIRSLISKLEMQLHANRILLSLDVDEASVDIQTLSNPDTCETQPDQWNLELKVIQNRIEFYRGRLEKMHISDEGCLVKIYIPTNGLGVLATG